MPPQNTVQVTMSAASAGVKAAYPPWKSETSILLVRRAGKQVAALNTWNTCRQHEMEMFSKTLLGRQVHDCISMSGSLCLHSSSVSLSTGVSVSLLPPPPGEKDVPLQEQTSKQKSHTGMFSDHLYSHPFLKSNLKLVPSMTCSAQIIKYSTAFNDKSRSPSKCDILPALFLHVISSTKASLPV